MSNELVKVQSGSIGMHADDFDGQYKIAKMYASASMCPTNYKGKPDEIMVAWDMGSQLGLNRYTSLKGIMVINGVVSVWGDIALGLIKKSGLLLKCEEWETGDGDNRTAHCLTRRKGEEGDHYTCFSVHDAKVAKLWGKAGPWMTHPKRMLKMKARGFNARDKFPDVLNGLFITEELFGEETIDEMPDQRAETLQNRLDGLRSSHPMPPKSPQLPVAIEVSTIDIEEPHQAYAPPIVDEDTGEVMDAPSELMDALFDDIDAPKSNLGGFQ